MQTIKRISDTIDSHVQTGIDFKKRKLQDIADRMNEVIKKANQSQQASSK